MLAGGLDGAYRAMLAYSPEYVSKLEVWRSGVRIDNFGDEGVPFIDGQLNATLTSQVTRQLSFSCHEELWPIDPSDLLAPYGNEIYAFMSVTSGATIPYKWQVFRGRINDISLETDGRVSVSCVDRAGDVNDAGFPAPMNSVVGSPIPIEFRRLVQDAVPDATFGTFDTIVTTTPALTWEWDRGSACDDLSIAAASFWYALANGDYVLRLVPWAIHQVPLLTLSDGESGVLVDAVPTLSRENVFNVVTVIGERADGTTPVYATLSDQNPVSPTYVLGGFGVKSKLIRVQAVINQGQATSVARTSLRKARSLLQNWSLEMPADPAMELGDCITVHARGLQSAIQVVANFTLPLLPTNAMSVSTRALHPVGMTEEEE